MPAAVDALHLLALMTLVRQARIDAGNIKAARLYDVRSFKCALAELEYLRRLRRRETGGTIVTSMTQLVKGLAVLHPRWKMTGDKFADRDRHHSAVRRRLSDLRDMGLLRWEAGLDVDGEEARTEIRLLTAPDVSVEQLAAARAQLCRWRRKYGRELNTGSSTGVRNALREGRPLSAAQRQQRGVVRARARAASRCIGSTPISGPHCEAPASPENCPSSVHLAATDNACGLGAGVRVNGVATSTVAATTKAVAASTRSATASLTDEVSAVRLADLEATRAARFERFAALQAERQPVLDLIASQAAQRAADVASWSVDRGWPLHRVREAFAVWRFGAAWVAEHSWQAAGPLEAGDPDRLRRAGRRYVRHLGAAPTTYPDEPLAALQAITETAAARGARPLTLHYAIRQFDQMTRRMRASDTVDDERRLQRRTAGARRRFDRADPDGVAFSWRAPDWSPWPPWVKRDSHGDPLLVDGALVVEEHCKAPAGSEHQPWVAPRPGTPAYNAVLADVHLLAGLWPPASGDGRRAMADGDDRGDNDLGPRRAHPGPYRPPASWGSKPDVEDLELAHRVAHLRLQDIQRLDVDERDRLLADARAYDRREQAERAEELRARLSKRSGDRPTPP